MTLKLLSLTIVFFGSFFINSFDNQISKEEEEEKYEYYTDDTIQEEEQQVKKLSLLIETIEENNNIYYLYTFIYNIIKNNNIIYELENFIYNKIQKVIEKKNNCNKDILQLHKNNNPLSFNDYSNKIYNKYFKATTIIFLNYICYKIFNDKKMTQNLKKCIALKEKISEEKITQEMLGKYIKMMFLILQKKNNLLPEMQLITSKLIERYSNKEEKKEESKLFNLFEKNENLKINHFRSLLKDYTEYGFNWTSQRITNKENKTGFIDIESIKFLFMYLKCINTDQWDHILSQLNKKEKKTLEDILNNKLVVEKEKEKEKVNKKNNIKYIKTIYDRKERSLIFEEKHYLILNKEGQIINKFIP
jgi:hypothetical protein